MIIILSIIAGGTLLAFITWGKELFGQKLFNQILTVIILLSVGLISYFIYQIYTEKEKVEDFIKDKWNWITKGAEEETDKVLYKDPRWDDNVQIKKDIIWSGEMITQLFGGSAYTAGQTTAQKTYDSFEERYGIKTVKKYEELPGTGRTLVSIGDYITGGVATDLGHKTGKLINKYKFW